MNGCSCQACVGGPNFNDDELSMFSLAQVDARIALAYEFWNARSLMKSEPEQPEVYVNGRKI